MHPASRPHLSFSPKDHHSNRLGIDLASGWRLSWLWVAEPHISHRVRGKNYREEWGSDSPSQALGSLHCLWSPPSAWASRVVGSCSLGDSPAFFRPMQTSNERVGDWSHLQSSRSSLLPFSFFWLFKANALHYVRCQKRILLTLVFMESG